MLCPCNEISSYLHLIAMSLLIPLNYFMHVLSYTNVVIPRHYMPVLLHSGCILRVFTFLCLVGRSGLTEYQFYSVDIAD